MLEIILFVVILSVLVFVHELGHFIAAKLSGMYVEEFAIGMPPKVVSKKIGETVYAIGLLPVGGYVKLYGEGGESSENQNTDVRLKERAYFNKPGWKKLVVLCAGVVMNLLTGLVLIALVIAVKGQPTMKHAIGIESVEPNSPAEEAGLAAGQFILAYKTPDDSTFTFVTDSQLFVEKIKANLDQPLELHIADEIVQEEEQLFRTVSATPRGFFNENEGSLGVKIVLVGYVYYVPLTWYQIPWVTLTESYNLLSLMIQGLRDMIANLFAGIVPQDIAGPVGIAIISKEVAQQGIIPLLNFVALISFNLALVNILPFPALDGGRAIFVIAEMLVRRPLDGKVQNYIHLGGIVVLLLLIGVITVYDVIRFL